MNKNLKEMNQSKIKGRFLSKLLCLWLLLTLYHQVLLSSSVGGYYIKGDAYIPQAGFLKVDNTTFILDIHDDGRVHVNFDIESKRKWYCLQAGSDHFQLHIKFYISDATPISLETEVNTIKSGEEKHFSDDFKLERSIVKKIQQCDVSINPVGTVESCTTRYRRRIFTLIGTCASLAIIIPSAILCPTGNRRRLSFANNNIEQPVNNVLL